MGNQLARVHFTAVVFPVPADKSTAILQLALATGKQQSCLARESCLTASIEIMLFGSSQQLYAFGFPHTARTVQSAVRAASELRVLVQNN